MAVSKVQICQRALAELKAQNIDSLTENTEEARLCALLYDEAVETLLELHRWDFSIEKAVLAQSTSTPVFEYTYYYQLPVDPYCVRVLEAYNQDGYELDDWKVEGRLLGCNEDYVQIRYIKRIDNIVETSPTFRETLVFWLAHKLAYSLTGSASMEQLMLSKYRMAMRKAIIMDSTQGAPYKETDDDYSWIESRFN